MSRVDTQGLEALIRRLRRYARASLGDRPRADACVAQTLDILLRTGEASERGAYRALYETLRRQRDVAFSDERLDEAALLAEGMRTLALLPRHALLLTSLEGLSVAEAATVMRLSVAEVQAHRAAALATLRQRLVAAVLVVEDDPIQADHMACLLTTLGHEVVDVVGTAADAVAAAAATHPSVMVADVELGDGRGGLDAVAAARRAMPLQAVFVTAFADRVMTAGLDEASFLITKPIDEPRLRLAMAAALRNRLRERPAPTAGSAAVREPCIDVG